MPRSRSPRAVVLVVALVALLGALLLWRETDDPAAPDGVAPPAGPTAGRAEAAHAALGKPAPTPTPTDAAAERERAAEPVPAPTAPAPTILRGRVVDSRGQALADVPLAMLAYEPAGIDLVPAPAACTTKSGPQGEFEIACDATRFALPAAGPGWFTLRTTPWQPGEAVRELLVVAAREVAVRGRTTRSDDGTPLAGVSVQTNLLYLTDFPISLSHTLAPTPPAATSDANGDYELTRAPLASGVDIDFLRNGFATVRAPSVNATGGRLDVSLQPDNASAGRIRGHVSDADGVVAGASLQLGYGQETTSDARGEFTFEAPEEPERLIAVRKGWQPVVLEKVTAGTRDLEVMFTQRSLSITGTVRLADGTPAKDYRLDLIDPTRGYGFRPIELDVLAACTDAQTFATTGADGRFEVGGLADRTYTLLAYEAARLICARSAPIPAGSRDVVITIPADALVDLRGVVVDRRGAPVADAAVSSWLAAASVEGAVGGPTAVTGADGTFVLDKAPRRGVNLGVSKEGWLYAVQPIEDWTKDGTTLRVVLTRMCSTRIEGPDGVVVQFADAAGEPVYAEIHSQTMVSASSAVELHGGKSPVLSLPETVTTMVWKRGDKEIGRKNVFLDPTPDAVTLLIAGN